MNTKLATTLLATTLAFLANASALTLSYNDSFSNLQATASAHSTGVTILGTFSDSDLASTNLSLPKFDSSLGTLNSVTFTITLSTNSTNASFTETGLGITVSAISLNRSLTLTVTELGGSVATGSNDLSGSPLASLLGISLGVSINTNGTLTNNTAVGNLSSGTMVSSPTLSAVTGTGNLSLQLSAQDIYQYTTLVGVSSTTWGGTSTYSGIGSVVYDYTAVPEPNAFALVTAAGMLLIVFRKRARRA